MTEVQEKTYHIVHDNGVEQRITVPADWKVTFGPAVVGPNKVRSDGYRMPMALRFYENKDTQRAIFTDVRSFRDISIKILTKKISVKEKQGFMECDGQRKATVFEARTEEWVDPDKLAETPQLPAPSKVKDFDVEFIDNSGTDQYEEEIS